MNAFKKKIDANGTPKDDFHDDHPTLLGLTNERAKNFLFSWLGSYLKHP